MSRQEYRENEAEARDAKARGSVKKKKKSRRKKRPFLRLLIFLLLCGILYFTASSRLFFVKTINVTGNSYYTPAQVTELSGLTTGKNLFFEVKTKPARDELLKSPYISFVEINRILPSTIEICITERAEYAAVPWEDRYIIIDSEGLVLRVADNEPTLTLLEGISPTSVTEGKPLETEQSYLLTDTLSLLKAADEADLYFKKVYFSTVVVRAYIYDTYYCEGTPSSMLSELENIKLLVAEHYSQNVTNGVIRVGENGYFAFSPKID